jgi:hypothetical protein
LTYLKIDEIVRRMCRQVFATLLIAGWIVLSGFDVLEDLKFPAQELVSENSHDATTGSTVANRGPLANNMVESAYRIQQDYICRFVSADLTIDLNAASEFHAYFQLHKLYRVFLI